METAVPLPHRRSIRLKDFDYAQPCAWFLTICAHEKKCIFGTVARDEMKMNALGRTANQCWLEIPKHFVNVRLISHIVMPNHIHGLIVIDSRARHAVPLQGIGCAEAFQCPVVGSVPTIIRSFKSATSKRIHELLRNTEWQVWQRNYYESRIRNQREGRNAHRYILENPANWRHDRHNPLATDVEAFSL
jgi:putative transposase